MSINHSSSDDKSVARQLRGQQHDENSLSPTEVRCHDDMCFLGKFQLLMSSHIPLFSKTLDTFKLHSLSIMVLVTIAYCTVIPLDNKGMGEDIIIYAP